MFFFYILDNILYSVYRLSMKAKNKQSCFTRREREKKKNLFFFGLIYTLNSRLRLTVIYSQRQPNKMTYRPFHEKNSTQ